MKFSHKLSLSLLLCGVVVLVILSFTAYKLSHDTLIKTQLANIGSTADEVSHDIDQFLHEKVKTALTLANMPDIIKVLETSNRFYAVLSDEKRKVLIKRFNKKWKSTKNINDKFILKFTDNNVSILLKNQQKILPGEYGEIFLTNKFGALVASTSKLSTFAHGHKYWWTGAYNNGKGAVFFDDRGYDDSVGGYVLGLVVPIKCGTQIIGILKCNLNIFGGISQLISHAKDKSPGKFKLTRSSGLIVFEEGYEPLSTRIHNSVLEKITSNYKNAFIAKDLAKKYLVGFSEIESTKGENGYRFGGTFESIDHKKGNTGESWYILYYYRLSLVEGEIMGLLKWIILISSVIIIVLVVVSLLFGQMITMPLTRLNKATKKIGKGEFEFNIGLQQNDEFGNLAHSFEKMVRELKHNTTSIKNLEKEVTERKAVEATLQIERDNLNVILKSMKDGVCITGTDFCIQYINPMLRNDFGLPDGKTCYEYFHHLKKPCISCRAEMVFSGRTVRQECYSDMTNKTYDIIESPMEKSDGSKLKLMVFRDITKLKSMETQLRQSQKMESVGQLAAGVAHEINNPIGFLSSNMEMLNDYFNSLNKLFECYQILEGMLGEISWKNISNEIKRQAQIISDFKKEIDIEYLKEDIPELLKDCMDGFLRVKKIVGDLKSFTSTGKDKKSLIDINKNMESILNLLHSELKDKVTISKKFGKIPLVEGYSKKLNQAFMNILKNATQAIQENGKIIIV
ncbi:MAG: HAMP domain-containing protein [Desulfobacteraceae bacterium]|nr:HAMP domain-containing protein [Desulfobacteraceae bacterium]